MSPSLTSYPFPSMRYLPAALAPAMDGWLLLCALKSSNATTCGLFLFRQYMCVWACKGQRRKAVTGPDRHTHIIRPNPAPNPTTTHRLPRP